MNKIGLFFGTETGTTRLIAKKIQKKLGDDIASKPLNVNRITPAELLQYNALILGTPSYGVEEIPCLQAGGQEANWAELVGSWSTEGYTFEQSAAVVDGRFVGLVLDQRTQSMHTDERIDGWLAQVKPLLLEKIANN